MSWSNPDSSTRGLQTFSQWRAECGGGFKKAPKGYYERLRDQRRWARPVGSQLKASEVPGLLSKALASGPIAAGDAFEHLLVVLRDNFHYHMYHFIVAEPNRFGGPRRVVMLADRTLHLSLAYPCPVDRYSHSLIKYASALGSPRIIFDAEDVEHQWRHDIAHSLEWTTAWPMGSELCQGKYSAYGNNMTMGLVLYREALDEQCVAHPEQEAWSDKAKKARLKPYNGQPGPLEISDFDEDVGRDILALALAYTEGPMSQLGRARRCSLR